MKKEGIMRINSYNKFFAEVAKIMNTSVKAVKQLDGRYKVELANHVYLNVYRGVEVSLFIHDCEQVHKQMKAISNPEWHHVSLKTLTNIDFDMLDEKRKVYLSFYKKWQEARKNLRKCSCGNSYERCYRVFRRSLTIALARKEISKALLEYFDRQISMVNVECGVWSSMVEVAMGQHYSRKYNRGTLRY